MECCSTAEATSTDTSSRECPSCGARGKLVKPITLDSLVREGTERRDERYRFCSTPGCGVAWFGETSGHQIPLAASSVRIGQKETAPDRTVCYCFQFTAADVYRQVAATGASTIPGEIAQHCRDGADRCPETNPQGSCCLGNVTSIAKKAKEHA